jgi:hypothetical protein
MTKVLVSLFVCSGKVVVPIGAGRDWLGMEFFCPTVKPEYPDLVTKAFLLRFEAVVNSEGFINKIRNTVAIIRC